MPRRKRYEVKVIEPDFKYQETLLQRIINKFTIHGARATASSIVYETFEELAQENNTSVSSIVSSCISKLEIEVKLVSKKVASFNYQIPVSINKTKSISFAVLFLFNGVKKRPELTLMSRLKGEIRSILSNEGKSYALELKNNILKLAKTNATYAHYLNKKNKKK